MSVHGVTNQFSNMGFGGGFPSSGYQQEHGEYNQHAPIQPQYLPPPDKPPLPQGWTPLFDQHYEHWYYVEDATGKTQWEAPGFVAAMPPMQSPPVPGRDVYAYHGPLPSGVYAGYDQSGPTGGKYGQGKGSGTGGLLLGAAGGLAAGAVIHHAMSRSSSSSSDRENDDRRSNTAAASYSYQGQHSSSHYPPLDPDVYSDDSDRESVEEVRNKRYNPGAGYQEKLQEAASSSTSTSDREEPEESDESDEVVCEAEEEYEEEYDDDFDDNYDDFDEDD